MSNDPQLQTSASTCRARARRVQSLGFHEDLSASSIVEQSLISFLDDHSEAERAALAGARSDVAPRVDGRELFDRRGIARRVLDLRDDLRAV